MGTYLITGGAGFYGTVLKKELLKDGNRCISIDLEPDYYQNKNYKKGVNWHGRKENSYVF